MSYQYLTGLKISKRWDQRLPYYETVIIPTRY
jgi:hypothetical protein